MVQLDGEERSYLLWGSVFFSALSIAYLCSTLEVDIDTSTNYRQLFSRVHGYMPADLLRRGHSRVGIWCELRAGMQDRLYAESYPFSSMRCRQLDHDC